MSARDNLIKEYIYSGWEEDKEKTRQFMEFIEQLEDEERITVYTADTVRSGVVDTLVGSEKFDWIKLIWLNKVIDTMAVKYTKQELKALIYLVESKGISE